MNLFESIYYDLLLEGKSPEEILGILKYKFKNVPEQIIDTVFNIDPTKKKSYTTWVLNHYDQEKHVIDNAIRNGSLKKLFGYLQSHQDAQLSKYQTLEEALYLVSNIDLLQKDSDDPKANDFDIVFKSPEWVIAVPNTYEASHKLGENTDWCTAGYKYNDGRGYYNNYLNRFGGKYFINFDLRSGEHINGIDYPFKRYQYHFESNQFMDADDNPVSFDETNMPEDVVNYYEENGYSFNKMNEEERIEEYEAARYDDGVRLTDNLWILQEYDHDNHELAQGNNASYMLYNVDIDDYDPVSYQFVQKEPLYVDNQQGIYILNTKWGDTNQYDSNLTEYNFEEDECEPIIVDESYGYNNTQFIDNIKYYKIMEIFGETLAVYFSDSKINDKQILSFGIYNKNTDADCQLPMKGDYVPVDIVVNDEVQAMFGIGLSDFVLEVIWNNSYHSLFNFYEDNCEVIVTGDKPTNGALFTLSENEEGDYVIHGMLRDYNGEDMTYSQGTVKTISHFVKDLFFNDLYIVQMTDKTYNIYNNENKHLLFNNNFTSFYINDTNSSYVQKHGLIIGKEKGSVKFSLYSLKNGNKVSDDWDLLQPSPNKDFFAASLGNFKTDHMIYIINGNLEKFGPYFSLHSVALKNNEIFVTERGENGEKGSVKLLDVETGEYKYNNLARLSPMNDLPVLFGLNEDNECLMYNYVTEQLLDRDIMINYTPKLMKKKGFEDYISIRHSSTGKMNLVNFKNGIKLLPEDVDNIEVTYGYDDYTVSHGTVDNCLAFMNNSTEYILHIDGDKTNLLPTPNGIVTGKTSNVYNYRTKGVQNPCITFNIHDSQDSESMLVTYNYVTNEAFVGEYTDYNPYSKVKRLKDCEPEIQQRVMQALNPQKAQFVAQYNEMINRMKKLI